MLTKLQQYCFEIVENVWAKHFSTPYMTPMTGLKNG